MTDSQNNLSDGIKFGVVDVPIVPLPQMIEQWKIIEEMGFDYLFTPDHIVNFLEPAGPWHDGLSVLGAMAIHTSIIRIGTLVTNPIMRPAATLAKQATTIDFLSNGRVELGIGGGAGTGEHNATGSENWNPRERKDRFLEFLNIVHGLFNNDGTPFTFEGEYYSCRDTTLVPASNQKPIPITIGGQGPSMLKAAVKQGDCWNICRPQDPDMDTSLKAIKEKMAQIDKICDEENRDPSTLRRSMFCEASWATPDKFPEIVEKFSAIGVQEFLTICVGDLAGVEKIARELIGL